MGLEEDIAVFERVPPLAALGKQALRILAIGVESRYVHSGEVLFNAGDEAAMAVATVAPRAGTRQVHWGGQAVLLPSQDLPQGLLRVERAV